MALRGRWPYLLEMRPIAAAVALVACLAALPAFAQVDQSFPGVAPANPAPPMLPVPPAIQQQSPAPSAAQPGRTRRSFSDRARDCLHDSATPSIDANRQGRDRDSVVRECVNK